MHTLSATHPRSDIPFTQPCSLLSVAEVAHRYGVSVRTIRRMIADGELAVVRVRGAIRIPESEVARLTMPCWAPLPEPTSSTKV